MPALALRAASDLAIQAAVSDVRPASEWLSRTGAGHGVPQEQIERLDLCLNEALANVIAHGNSEGRVTPVALHLEVRASDSAHGEASVTVRDEGPAFDMATAALPERPKTLAEAEPGGLGLLMIRQLSDAVSYQRIDGMNALTFCVRWG